MYATAVPQDLSEVGYSFFFFKVYGDVLDAVA